MSLATAPHREMPRVEALGHVAVGLLILHPEVVQTDPRCVEGEGFRRQTSDLVTRTGQYCTIGLDSRVEVEVE